MIPISDTIARRNPPIATWLPILASGLVFLFDLVLRLPVGQCIALDRAAPADHGSPARQTAAPVILLDASN